jgi:alkylation response protein AidB-like acyl-CoA dehydrogenase
MLTSEAICLFDKTQFSSLSSRLGMDSHMRLLRARLDGGTPIALADSATSLDHARANLLIAAYATGVAEAALGGAVEYAKVREQFGKLIGSFQAVKHKCADMAIAAEVASCQAAFASVILAKGDAQSRFHALAARIVAVDAALKNGATGIQVHGAIGFTAEVDAHLYVKRAHLIDFMGGDQRVQKGQFISAPAAM